MVVRGAAQSRAGLFGSGLSFSKCFWPLSGVHTNFFSILFRTTIFFIRDVARISLTSYAFSEGEEMSTRWSWVEKIKHLRDSLLVLKNDLAPGKDGSQSGFKHKCRAGFGLVDSGRVRVSK